MLKSKSELDSFLNETFTKKSFDPIAEQVVEDVNKRHNIPKGVVSDYIFGRKSMEKADEVTTYCILNSIIEIEPKDKKEVFIERMNAYYTAIEQKKYNKYKQETNDLKFPIIIPCFQVAPEQWIGYSNISFLMQLRNAQKIRYNENAQRVLKKKVRGDQETYTISLNKKAVNDIRKAYRDGMYIPNTITLNMPEDIDVSYKYDSESHQLIINKIETFDITDGYHRYIAASKEYDDGNEFDVPIELRILQFSDEKAREFIYQEDQKTKMTKVESESMNVNSPANFLCERLNSSSSSYLKGYILRAKGIVNYPNLSSCIAKYYLDGKKDYQRVELISLYKELEDFYNTLIENESELLEQAWTYDYILASALIASCSRQRRIPDINKAVNELSKLFKGLRYNPSTKVSVAAINEAVTKVVTSL